MVDGLEVAEAVGSVGARLVTFVFESFGVRSGIVAASLTSHAAVACVIGVVGREEPNQELVFPPAGIRNDVFPLGGLVLGAFGEPGSIPCGSVHCLAVEAFGAKETRAGNRLPLVR